MSRISPKAPRSISKSVPVQQDAPKTTEAGTAGWAPKVSKSKSGATPVSALIPPGRTLTGAAGLADALVRSGIPNGPQLLARMPGINETLSRFATLAKPGNPAEQKQAAFAALRQYAVQTGRPIPQELKVALGGSDAAIASDYAKDLGYSGVRKDGARCLLLGAGPQPQELNPASGSLADLGKAINAVRFATTQATPPLAPVNVAGAEFGVDEAHLATHLASPRRFRQA
jgi:hypothetical protein